MISFTNYKTEKIIVDIWGNIIEPLLVSKAADE